MLDHWRAGYNDADRTLAHPEVLCLPTLAESPAIYDFLGTRHQAAVATDLATAASSHSTTTKAHP
jgi:NTE family protein